MTMSSTQPTRKFSVLDLIEWAGNKLPDPAMLFVWCTALIMALSALGTWRGWQVQPVRPEVVTQPVSDPSTGQSVGTPVLRADGRPEVRLVPFGAPVVTKSLLNSDGVFWLFRSLVKNFVEFPPLGVVVVTMLGVGVAERTGLMATLLKGLALLVPSQFFTPMMVFLGVQSSMAADAGYLVLPPLAAALYKSVGRSPLAGIAAAFSGIGAGFSANLLVTSLDPLLSTLTESGAKVIDPAYSVNAACNWWFMAASTGLLTIVGWAVTAWFVEPRLSRRAADDGGACLAPSSAALDAKLSGQEIRGLTWAAAALVVGGAAVLALVIPEGAPLHGGAEPFSKSPRWIVGIVPIITVLFLIPGIAYGAASRSVRGGKDVAQLMSETVASIAPILVLAFFAGQFIACFKYSQLDQILAYSLGTMLAESGLSPTLLLVAFIGLVMIINILMSSASAKWSLLASVFVPIFMLLQVSPELTQAAYRVGDSCTNIVTPLNAYLVVLLIAARKDAPRAGTGTLISMMMPYSIVFAICWTGFLLLWIWAGADLGPGGGHVYPPAP